MIDMENGNQVSRRRGITLRVLGRKGTSNNPLPSKYATGVCKCSWVLAVFLNNSYGHCNLSIYIVLVWVFVCLSVRLYPTNVKMVEPIGLNFLWDLAWPQGRFMDDRIFKNLATSKFYFLQNPRNFCFTMFTKRT